MVENCISEVVEPVVEEIPVVPEFDGIPVVTPEVAIDIVVMPVVSVVMPAAVPVVAKVVPVCPVVDCDEESCQLHKSECLSKPSIPPNSETLVFPESVEIAG